MANCSQVVLLFFNVIFLLAGLGLFTVGILVQFTKTAYHEFIGSSLIPIASYMLIGAGGVVLLMSLAGCCGALTKNRMLLGLYIIFLILMFLVEAAAGIMGFVFSDKVRPILDEYVKDGMMSKYGYPGYELVTNAINVLQQEFKCCGYEGRSDWGAAAYYTSVDAGIVADRGLNIMPLSCCIDVNVDLCNNADDNTKNFNEGCVDKLTSWVTANLYLVGGVAIGVAVLQLLGIVLSILLMKKSKEDDGDF